MNETWTFAAPLASLRRDDVVAVAVAGAQIALYDIGGEIFATDNLCTHGDARLCDGFLEDGTIECPLHQGRFDVRSGKALCKPLTENLRTYPIRVEGEQVFVALEAEAAAAEALWQAT